MAGASRRTSICLTGTAIVFIIVIIILCVIPDPCRDRDPRPECRITGSAKSSLTTPKDVIIDESTLTISTFSMTEPTSTEWSSTSSVSSSIGSSTAEDSTTESTYGVVTFGPSTNRTPETIERTEAYYEVTNATAITQDTTPDDYNTTTGREAWSKTTTDHYDTTNKTAAWKTTTPDYYDDDTTNETEVWSRTTTFDYETTNETEAWKRTTPDYYDNDTTNETEVWSRTTTDDYDTTNETAAWKRTTPDYYHNDTTNATEVWSRTTTGDYDTTNETEAWTTSSYEIDDTNSTEFANTTDGSTVEVTNATIKMTQTTSTTPEPTTFAATTTIASTTTDIPPIMIKDGVCDTKACKELAARMLDTMDHGDVDPCQDFYQYSCGGVLDDLFLKPENAQLPADILIKKALARADRNDTYLKELLVVYDSCLNFSRSHTQEERISEIRNVFESLGYHFNPLAVGNVNPADYPGFGDDFDLSVALARMMKKHFTPFFDFTIDVDDENSSQFVYKMTLPTFTSPFTQSSAKQVCYNKYKEKADEARVKGVPFNISIHYNDYVNCTTAGIGLAARLDRMSAGVDALKLTSHIINSTHSSQLISGARTTLDFMLKSIAEILPSPPEIKKMILKKKYDKFTLRQLDDGTAFSNNFIKFDTFFKELTGKPLNLDSTYIQVYFKDTLNEIFDIMNTDMSDSKLAQNMMLFLWTESVYGDLVKPIGPKPGSQEYCFNAVSSLMDDYITYLYLGKLPNREELSIQMKRMIQRIKQQAEDQMKLMSTAVEFQDKVNEMAGEVARLEEATEVIQNRPDGDKMPVIKNDFVKNYQNLMENYRKRLYDLLDKDTTEPHALWSFHQLTYKSAGVTSYALNKFLIPHAAMNPPYYYGSEVPSYINYAGIGHMIGHEFMHGFDSTGIEFSESGRIKLKPNNRVVAQTECLAEDLMADFTRNSSTGMQYVYKLNSNLSLNELLVDSAATKLAWDTYKKELAGGSGGRGSTAAGTYRTLPPARRRRREVEDLSFAIEGLRSRAKRQASMPAHLGDFEGILLPYLTNFTALQLYFIKMAQNQCSETSEINIVDVMEKEHLPPNLRVNLMLRHDPLFAKAFNCPVSSYMGPKIPICQFDPWVADVVTVS